MHTPEPGPATERAKDEVPPTASSAAASGLALQKYVDVSALKAFVTGGDVQLLRASFLLELAAARTPFLARQDVPERGCCDSAMLDCAFREYAEWHQFQRDNPDDPNFESSMCFPPIVVVSYAWASQEHPDADASQLCAVLAPAIEWYMAERARLIKRGKEGYVQSPTFRLSTPFTSDGVDFGVFIDYSSLYQHPRGNEDCNDCLRLASAHDRCLRHKRTDAQAASFKRALHEMDLLYAHQHSCVWRLTRRLPGQTHRPYLERGWPWFETAVSWLVKPNYHCLDLGSDRAVRCAIQGFQHDEGRRSRTLRFEGRLRTPKELLKLASYENPDEPGMLAVLTGMRRPPLLPDVFAALLDKRTVFTNGADSNVVKLLYTRVATSVLSGVTQLDFQIPDPEYSLDALEIEEAQAAGVSVRSLIGWGAVEGGELGAALSWCGRLESLILDGNCLGEVGGAAVAEGLGSCPAITCLSLQGCKVGPAAVSTIAALLPGWLGLERLKLVDCKADVAAAVAIADGLLCGPARHLVQLRINHNAIGPLGATALARYVEIAPSLTDLDLNNNRIGGRNRPPEALHALLAALTRAVQNTPASGELVLALYDNDLDCEFERQLRKAAPERVFVEFAADGNDESDCEVEADYTCCLSVVRRRGV